MDDDAGNVLASATTVWQKECTAGSIITSIIKLDSALSNGIPIGVITEICGPPGSGKTQICHQLSVNVQFPAELKGLDGDTIFIDTKRGFSPYRFRQIASSQSNHCQMLYRKKTGKPLESLVGRFMNGLKLFIVNDIVQLLAIIHNLKNVMSESSRRIRLIVIDSFSFLFRQMKNDENCFNRTHLLYDTLTNLQLLADEFGCAVVITNELTTRVIGPNDTLLLPSLGDAYSHRVTQQITLGREDFRSDVFCASIDKVRHSPEIIIKFRITENGINEV